jgi:pimeloyl-ACP methyl ester carboxylesterase
MNERWIMRRIAVRGGHLALRTIGAGPDVVLVHGIPGSGRVWDTVAARLAERHRVVVPDLLGFGQSGRPREAEELWADAQQDALASALDGLGIRRATIVGHDFGGPIALELVSERPDLVSHLVLASTNAFPDTPIPFPLSTVTWPFVGPVAGRVVLSGSALSMSLRLGVGRPKVRLDPSIYLGDPEQRRAIRTIFASSLRGLAERYGPIAEGLGAIAVPTLVLWGDRDPFFTVEQGRRTAAAIPGARFVLLEGAGHFLPEERPHAVVEAIASLIREGAHR